MLSRYPPEECLDRIGWAMGELSFQSDRFELHPIPFARWD